MTERPPDPTDEHEHELRLFEPAATRWLRAAARRWPTMLGVALLLVLAYASRSHLGTRIVQRQLETATTPEAETSALCRMNDWARAGHTANYELRALDANGEPLRPTRDGSYDQIATLVIRWRNGSQVARELLGHDGLACAYHG